MEAPDPRPAYLQSPAATQEFAGGLAPKWACLLLYWSTADPDPLPPLPRVVASLARWTKTDCQHGLGTMAQAAGEQRRHPADLQLLGQSSPRYWLGGA